MKRPFIHVKRMARKMKETVRETQDNRGAPCTFNMDEAVEAQVAGHKLPLGQL